MNKPADYIEPNFAGLSATGAERRHSHMQSEPQYANSKSISPQTQHHANPVRANDTRGLDFVTIERGDYEYMAATKHTSKVKFLKIALPVTAGLIILGIIGALFVNSFVLPEAEIASVSLDNGSLVMENPELSGFDKNKRPFSLTAERAVQDVSNPTRVELQQISAELPVDDAVSAKIQAGNGIYDAELKTLILDDTISVQTNNGLQLRLDDANINIDEGTLQTSGAVTASSPQADIYAESVSVLERGNRVKFSGNVRMTVRPKALQEASE